MPGRRRLRYTPTIAASGPMAPVPTPAEFFDPRSSGPLDVPDYPDTSGWFDPKRHVPEADPRSARQPGPPPGAGRQTGPQVQARPWRDNGPQSWAAPRRDTGPQAQAAQRPARPQAAPRYPTGPQDAARYGTGQGAAERYPTGPQASYQTGPQAPPRYPTGPQAAPRYPTGPQAAARYDTGPQASERRPTGPQPAPRYPTGPQAAARYDTGPRAAERYGPGSQSGAGYGTGPQSAAGYGTGPQAAQRRPTGPQAAPRYPTGPQAAARYGTGPQAPTRYGTGPQATDRYGTRPRTPARYGTGPQAAAGYRTGPQTVAGYGTGPQAPVRRPTGPQRTQGPRTPGPRAPGPRTSGPRAPGPRTSGPQRQNGPYRGSARDRDGLDGRRDQGTLRRLRDMGDRYDEPGLGNRMASAVAATMRSRNWVTGLAVPILAAIAVGIAIVVVAGANHGNGGPAPSTLSTDFPPASSAAADFTDTAALAGRGISGPLGQVAAVGSDIVAVGAQNGPNIAGARFFFSADAGRTWRLGTVQAQGGAAAPSGHAATLVAGDTHGWVAVGPTAVWTSQNGTSWLLEPTLPQQAGDKITALTATGSGYLAVGQNIPGGNAAKATPVVWLSANGTTWQRLSGTRLDLTAGAGTGTVTGITAAAANGGVIVIAGTVGGATSGSQVWRSSNGGQSWTAVTIPATSGAEGTISGLAPLKTGFVAVQPAQVSGVAGALVYTSADGTAWQQTASLTSADSAPLTIGLVSGGPGGAVVAAQADGFDVAFLSQNGTSWTGTDPVGTTAREQVDGIALNSAGQAVFSATSTGNTAGQPALTLIGAQGGPDVIDMRAIPGFVTAQVAVNAIASSSAAQVAVGSADGLPAAWVSTNGGSTWTRGTGTPTAALTQPGEEELTGVAYGAAGWVAVGGGLGATQQSPVAPSAEPPVVIGSATGQAWTAENGGTAFTGSGQVVTEAVAAGRGGYVIAGYDTTGNHRVAAAWYSAGLTGWQRAQDAQAGALDGAGNRQMNAVTATTGGFVAVGSAGLRPAAWLSPVGRSWTLVTMPLPGSAVRAELGYAAASGGTVAAMGTEVTASGQQLPFAAVSRDGGTTWTETTLPVPRESADATTAVTALAAAGGGFTATGTYSAAGNQDVMIWMLSRGAAPATGWTMATPAVTGLAGPGTQAINALAQTGSTLTGAGFLATSASEEPTIWQSPIRG
jgi:hypothetical protein